MGVKIQLLGPVRAWRDGDELDLGGPGQRAVLVLLAVESGQVLPRARLVDALWGDRPPPSAVNVIQTYVKGLRRSLEPDRRPRSPSVILPSVGSGYALHLPAVDLDLARFRDLVRAGMLAHRAGDPARAVGVLGEALALWHGPPVADLAQLADHPKVVALARERWAAVGRYGESLIAAGAAADAVPILHEAATAQPLDEVAQASLIRAYHAAGQREQAFSMYHSARRRLADELGVDPGPELAEALADLLAQDRAAATVNGPANGSAAVPRPVAPPAVTPAQLPTDMASFSGRVEELRLLDKLLPPDGEASPATVVIAIVGAAGVGKTTLAVHWAHKAVDSFPDGQLFVNLRGFDPAGSAMSPAEAVRALLEALEVPPQRIPVSLDAQVGLYRSLLAGRRMLILLDNARDPAQVRPLLPGSPGCLVLVTSRNQLSGLIAEAARPLSLDLLPTADARQLLARRVGADRLAGEPQATDEIIDRCGGLPLALAIVAARAATHPHFPLAALADELHRTAGGLDGFTGGEPATDLGVVFSCSYRALNPPTARLFRLLGPHPGPDLSAPAAASLAGIGLPRTRTLLAELTRAHLVTEHAPGRYAFHDLLRTYAAQLAHSIDTDAERRAAQLRMLDHYLHTAHAAARLLQPHLDGSDLAVARPGTTPERLTEREQAVGWFRVEHPVLVAAVTHAANAGLDTHAFQLARALAVYLMRAHWHDLAHTQETALRAARRFGDRAAQAHAHRGVGRAESLLGRYADAATHLEHALDLLRDLGDRTGQAHTELAFGLLLERQGHHREAIARCEQALALFRTTNHQVGQARSLNGIGWCHAQLGEFDQAITSCQQALALQQQIGDQAGQGDTWDSLGYAHHHRGHYDQAVECYQHAVRAHRGSGDRYHEANTLTHLADTHHARGDTDDARSAWQHALAILDQLGHPDADQVRAKLHTNLSLDGRRVTSVGGLG
jgi:DNA-binding SARP family transcriptional activator